MTAWLALCCVLVATMVAVGGYTRLSGSGLSITEWAPVRGTVPPLTEAQWKEQFARYLESPEGRLVNSSLDLAGFQRIFLVEWGHRFLGRLVGFVTVVPLAWFLWRRALDRRTARRGLLAAALVGAQGAMGWLMVKSGLVDVPHVSTVRLGAHLLLAFAIFAVLAWELFDLVLAPATVSARRLVFGARAFLAVIVVTVASGAAMAGTHAGWAFSTFPTMNGRFLPDGVFEGGPRAAIQDPLTAHFDHRAMALVVLIFAIALPYLARGEARAVQRRVALVLGAVALQITLGAATVMLRMPVWMAVVHQVWGLGLFATALGLVHGTVSAQPSERAMPSASPRQGVADVEGLSG
ncbi:MAG: COX15/CtaA family protein [Deltaproteobacteria bacterium]|nr:COX15/CtaA family protein [Deltaproteobacteria bacterium]